MKKTAVAAALTALAVPSAAVADHREHPDRGHGTDRSEQRRGDSQDQRQNRNRSQNRNRRGKQRVGFVVSGTGLAGTDNGTLALPLTLDITSANKHARQLLGIDRAFIASAERKPVGTSGDSVLVRFEGISDTDNDGNVFEHVAVTDRVKVIGKVTRTRSRDADGDRKVEYSDLNVRKVVVSRGSAEDDS